MAAPKQWGMSSEVEAKLPISPPSHHQSPQEPVFTTCSGGRITTQSLQPVPSVSPNFMAVLVLDIPSVAGLNITGVTLTGLSQGEDALGVLAQTLS